MAKADITMYGADWCGDCRRSKRLFEELDVQVNHIDVEADASAAEKVIEINGGAKSIPVIVFSDGTHLTEPSDNDLKAKLQALNINRYGTRPLRSLLPKAPQLEKAHAGLAPIQPRQLLPFSDLRQSANLE
ncbi:MAG: hypothetical protein RJA40_904 [Actinomycetota bacterium]